MYYGDGSYWDVIEGNIKRCEKQPVSNVSSTIRLLSHLRDSHPTHLVLTGPLPPNLILAPGAFRHWDPRASKVFLFYAVSTEFPMLCVTLNFAAKPIALRNAKWPDTMAIGFSRWILLRG